MADTLADEAFRPGQVKVYECEYHIVLCPSAAARSCGMKGQFSDFGDDLPSGCTKPTLEEEGRLNYMGLCENFTVLYFIQ